MFNDLFAPDMKKGFPIPTTVNAGGMSEVVLTGRFSCVFSFHFSVTRRTDAIAGKASLNVIDKDKLIVGVVSILANHRQKERKKVAVGVQTKLLPINTHIAMSTKGV